MREFEFGRCSSFILQNYYLRKLFVLALILAEVVGISYSTLVSTNRAFKVEMDRTRKD